MQAFENWYVDRRLDRDGCLDYRGFAPECDVIWRRWERYKREADARLANYDKLIKVADNEVATPKKDLANVSSGETAGMVRRLARNLVQHTPNVDIINEFDDDSVKGVFVRHILKTKIIGDDLYSNDMQQNLFASAKSAITLGFDCVVPVLLQDAAGGWYMKYDTIYYRDVFPEPGAKDVRQAPDVFVRRYLTPGEVRQLIRSQPAGWDIPALKKLLQNRPPVREEQSVDHQSKKHHALPEGYELITYYTSTGDPFLTIDVRSKMLLRVEKNKHPLKQHPVFFLVLEKDANQPYGKSQVELVYGRQEFQDLLLNGAMKMWYRNINPPLIGYGTINAIPNLSPGKYTSIANPNAKVEALEINTQTLLQFGQIATQNAGAMTQLTGAADQQMAMQSTAGQMSATPQGVQAQQTMVDITTNNYQKAIESFFSRYCSYALTIFFAELRGIREVTPTADTRQQLINAGFDPALIDNDGKIKIDFSTLATEYFVRAVPGSLVELEDEKQLRILNELFIPLSQAMPAIAQAGNPQALAHAVAAMQFIIQKQLELSGSAHSTDLKALMETGMTSAMQQRQNEIEELEERIGTVTAEHDQKIEEMEARAKSIETALKLLVEGQGHMMSSLGVPMDQTEPQMAGIPA